jgi:DNA-binding HxlR family transcriptional regulator
MPKRYTPTSAAADVEAALRLLEGRWKLVILFHLFGGKVMRFSDLERAIPNITQIRCRQHGTEPQGVGL